MTESSREPGRRCEIFDYLCWTDFFVSVDLGCDCDCGLVPIAWSARGDGYGLPPHADAGAFTFEVLCLTPTEPSTWSSVKTLF